MNTSIITDIPVEAFMLKETEEILPPMRVLQDMLRVAYPDDSDEEIKKIVTRAKQGEVNLGIIWERVAHMFMKSKRLLKNSAWRDSEDNSDMKFCKVIRIDNKKNSPNTFQATISTKNKIGYLRVCLWDPVGMDKLYFMLIPHKYYSKLKGHPLKITFQNFMPIGKHWALHGCSFSTVVETVEDDSKEILQAKLTSLAPKFKSQA
jgi:hypothetical protein